MKDGAFNPDMLRLAREAREMTQAELAKEASVTQALISKLEHGLIAQPSDEVMNSLSKAVRFPTAFFYQRERAIGFPAYHYRKRTKIPAKPLARICAVINIRRQHLAKLLRSYDLEVAKPIPQIDLDESGLSPEKVAERLRAYWLLPRGPIVSVVDTIEQAGGIVIPTSFQTKLLDGISFRSEGMPPLFFMNKDIAGDRFRFSLAHELGHIVMHTVPDDDKIMEDQAHRFAAAFLMPSSDIRSYLMNAKISSLARVRDYWKVSIKSLINRSYDLKLITDSQYKNMNVQYNKMIADSDTLILDNEAPWRLLDVVNYHCEELGYSVTDLSKLLAVNEADIEKNYLPKQGLRLVISN